MWREGRYYYPRNDGPVSDEDDHLSVTATAGNAMLPFARLNPGGGLFRLHNETWPESYFEQPYIAAVDLGAVGVSQAIYDAEREALVVGLEPGPLQLAETRFEVRNLDRRTTWDLFRDGRFVATISEGGPLAEHGIEWQEGEPIRVSVDPTAPVSLVLRKSPGQAVAGL